MAVSMWRSALVLNDISDWRTTFSLGEAETCEADVAVPSVKTPVARCAHEWQKHLATSIYVPSGSSTRCHGPAHLLATALGGISASLAVVRREADVPQASS